MSWFRGVLVFFHLVVNQNKEKARAQAGLGHLAPLGAHGASFDLCKWPRATLCLRCMLVKHELGGKRRSVAGTVCSSFLMGAELPVAAFGPRDFTFLFGLKIKLPFLTQESLRLH